MEKFNPLKASIEDWENFLVNRSNTREITYHGGGSPLFQVLLVVQQCDEVVLVYEKVVQATLNRWNEMADVVREDWEVDPIQAVMGVPFGRCSYFIEDLRPSFSRLWIESPRPHSDYHRYLICNFGAELPVSLLIVQLLFQQDQWGLPATLLASYKGFQNTAIEMMNKLSQCNETLKLDDIINLVELGFPKLKGFRWLYFLPEGDEYTLSIMKRWREELLAEGVPNSELLELPT